LRPLAARPSSRGREGSGFGGVTQRKEGTQTTTPILTHIPHKPPEKPKVTFPNTLTFSSYITHQREGHPQFYRGAIQGVPKLFFIFLYKNGKNSTPVDRV